jgi:LemA protein
VSLILVVVLVAVLWLGWTYVGRRNDLVRQREAVNAAWSQVDIVLQRRADLIPNLVEEKISANGQLDAALGAYLGSARIILQLKSNENFLRLQDKLAGTENRIAVERRWYNEAVQSYNTYIAVFPNNLVAGTAGSSRNDAYFKADESARQVPRVQFPGVPSQNPAPAPATR